MKFLDFLRIRDKFYLVSLNPMALLSAMFLLYCFDPGPATGVFCLILLACMIGFMHMLFEYRLFKKVSYPTWYIYDSLMKASDAITVTNRKAGLYTAAGTIIYKREFPGRLENEEFEYFSLVENEIIEYPFRRAVIKFQAEHASEKHLTQEHRTNRKRIAHYFKT